MVKSGLLLKEVEITGTTTVTVVGEVPKNHLLFIKGSGSSVNVRVAVKFLVTPDPPVETETGRVDSYGIDLNDARWDSKFASTIDAPDGIVYISSFTKNDNKWYAVLPGEPMLEGRICKFYVSGNSGNGAAIISLGIGS